MCGICGIVTVRETQIAGAVRRMMRAMVHRGPDDEGYEEIAFGPGLSSPRIGLGFRRLAILDLTPTGHQPMFNPNTGDCLIFNGEIYNFKSLRAELQCDGVRFRGTSDSEVLLHALSRWGDAVIPRLNGMYAFAFHKADSHQLLLARDPLGIKPLYVAETCNELVFASEVRAVLASGVVSDELDPAGIASMLAYGAPQDPLTIHRAIKSFPAGCYGWIRLRHDGTVAPLEPKRFWRFSRQIDSPPSAEIAAAEVRRLLEKAVAQHLVADRPVGVFLSAGIDSFAIAALAKAARGDIKTFTVGFEEASIENEVQEAAAAAHVLGADHQRIVLKSADVEPLWTSWLEMADRPSIDGFNTFIVSHAVKRAGKAVALSGLGGDELFGGYPNFAAAKHYSLLLKALCPVPASMRTLGIKWLLSGRSQAFRDRATELACGGASIERIALRLRRILTDRQLSDLGVDRRGLSIDEHFLDPSTLAATGHGGADDSFNTTARLECSLYMGNTLLRDTDAVSMTQSLEVRVPLLDRSIVDYVMALPEGVKVRRRGPTKFLLRSALDQVIPEELRNRPKTGFCLPIDRWMHGPLRDFCQAAIDYLAKSDVLNGREVRQQWDLFSSSTANVHWTRPMTLVALGSYLRNRSSRG